MDQILTTIGNTLEFGNGQCTKVTNSTSSPFWGPDSLKDTTKSGEIPSMQWNWHHGPCSGRTDRIFYTRYTGEIPPMEMELPHGPCRGSRSSWIFCTRYTGGFPPMEWTMELCELGNPWKVRRLNTYYSWGESLGNGEWRRTSRTCIQGSWS